jgi:hypothetical protein
VHINDNKGVQGDLLLFGEWLPHQFNQIVELFCQFIVIFIDLLGVDGYLNLLSPLDLRAVKDALTWMVTNPLSSLGTLVLLYRDK